MSWRRVLNVDFGTSQPLICQVHNLFAQQRGTWPALRAGEQALENLQQKSLDSDEGWIIVQMNPARRASTTAKTDALSLATRPCFLCPNNMPIEERGVPFEDLVIMPNPFPILPMHCTIAAREHRPQEIRGQLDKFLRLASNLGPGLVALYNGPRCGASAPDHFHFQAARADVIPILPQLPVASDQNGILHTSLGRTMFVYSGDDPALLLIEIGRTIDSLRALEQATNRYSDDEPMFNLLAYACAGHYRVILFPRAAHRPASYYAEGGERVAVSPAILEMCGILVATDPDDFARLDMQVARSIYAEVSVRSEILSTSG